MSYAFFFTFDQETPMGKFPVLSTMGIKLGAGTALAGAILDQEQEVYPEMSLYVESWTNILFNLLVLGPIVYAHVESSAIPKKLFQNVFDTVSLILYHSGLYSIVHRCMHRIRAFRPMHNFHHRFKHRVMPSSANAVSTMEFIAAYMIPFIVGSIIVKPSKTSILTAASIVSVFNLLVHSESMPQKTWIPGFVRPRDHLQHHRTKTANYSAPTIFWERIFNH